MSRLHPAAVVAVIVTLCVLAPSAAAQINFGTAELGEIRTACQLLCFAQTPQECDGGGIVQPVTAEPPYFVRGVRRGPASEDLCNKPGLADPVTFPVNLQPGQALIVDIDLVADQVGPADGLLRIGGDPLVELQAGVVPAGPCPPSAPDTLCLVDERFTVRANWRTLNGPRGKAAKVQGVASDDSGLFYFFNPDNWEMLIKMVDACDDPFNHFWVFYAATTNVEFTVTVTDTQEDVTRVYTNPLGTPAQPIQDTQAFATCP